MQVLGGSSRTGGDKRVYTGRVCSRVQKSCEVEGVKGVAKSLC